MILKMKHFNKSIPVIVIILLFFQFKTLEGKTLTIGSYNNWTAYTSLIEKSKTCFLASKPINSLGKYDRNNRDKTYVFVTNIKGTTIHEVSVVAGFNYKKNSEVIFNIDGKKTKMFPVEDRAWSKSSKIDSSLVIQMKRCKELTVTGIS